VFGWLKRVFLDFQRDPEVAPANSATPDDYNVQGFDPGHQAASANQSANLDRMRDTFFLSNNAPQREGLNRGPWVELESQIRQWVKARGEVRVVTGPLVLAETRFALCPDGYKLPREIGAGVVVPTHFFKVIVWRSTKEERRATAYIFRNCDCQESESFKERRASLVEIERLGGLVLFPDLADAQRRQVESDSAFHDWVNPRFTAVMACERGGH
jgi:DNA/RNA endonuclease G (NUC1)